MRKPSPAIALDANWDVAQSCDTSRTPVRAIDLTKRIVQRAHKLWKTNVRLNLAPHTGIKPRTVDHWEAGEREISTEALLTLVDSDDANIADEFFAILMGRMRPDVVGRWLDQQMLRIKIEKSRETTRRAAERTRRNEQQYALKFKG